MERLSGVQAEPVRVRARGGGGSHRGLRTAVQRDPPRAASRVVRPRGAEVLPLRRRAIRVGRRILSTHGLRRRGGPRRAERGRPAEAGDDGRVRTETARVHAVLRGVHAGGARDASARDGSRVVVDLAAAEPDPAEPALRRVLYTGPHTTAFAW
eukprot:9799-Pelagococcus_subviridis.AAC.1